MKPAVPGSAFKALWSWLPLVVYKTARRTLWAGKDFFRKPRTMPGLFAGESKQGISTWQ